MHHFTLFHSEQLKDKESFGFAELFVLVLVLLIDKGRLCLRQAKPDSSIEILMNNTQQLCPRAYQIMDLYIDGYGTNEIARKLNITPQYVGMIINAPNFQHSIAIRKAQLVEQVDARIADQIVDATAVLKSNAKKAAERLVSLLDSDHESIQLKSSLEVLAIDGVQSVKTPDAAIAVVNIGEKEAKIIAETLKMKEKSDGQPASADKVDH